ncbi:MULTISPECIES: hypothetical protein [Serratia]|uniref:hypothetical protein n=1 Tax=Serratia TaxID=613 RepID=UPI002747E712|nr:hypothetical protein [Serratia marcescens]MDP8624887.1 hypothetical protein [Serratia marcescens]MDP8674318.1 hypothetical protein [Serratia marcescens]MDP8689320.1 hypothetical protein [Serratia marcescens]MDP8699067.1 hypothetical protein [Serratia marcescens]MDP8708745.1 hypothetical protein [Serratia marcescens]
MDNKLSELSKPVAWKFKNADGGDRVSLERKANIYGRHDFQPCYSQEYVSALLARIEELEWRELNSTELKELLTWHPTEKSAATDPILWAAMRNKINFTLARIAVDEAMKDQSNG